MKGELRKMRLKELRARENLRQQDIADFLECSLSKISQIELGNSEFCQSEIIKLADFFKVTTDYFLGVSDRSIEEDRRLIKMVNAIDSLNFKNDEKK
jgi:transcriptional regulator with XRE-family HTH domain